jgi:ubiquitin-conjugating enzyme E2 O
VRSGIVTRARVNGRCEHVISGERIEGWTSLEELSDRTYAEVGDYVTYNDWIGQVRVQTANAIRFLIDPFL